MNFLLKNNNNNNNNNDGNNNKNLPFLSALLERSGAPSLLPAPHPLSLREAPGGAVEHPHPRSPSSAASRTQTGLGGPRAGQDGSGPLDGRLERLERAKCPRARGAWGRSCQGGGKGNKARGK